MKSLKLAIELIVCAGLFSNCCLSPKQ